MFRFSANHIKNLGPRPGPYSEFLQKLNKTKADDDLLDYAAVINKYDLDSLIWSLQIFSPERDEEIRAFAVACAEAVTKEPVNVGKLVTPDFELADIIYNGRKIWASRKTSREDLIADATASCSIENPVYAALCASISARIAGALEIDQKQLFMEMFG